MSHQPDDYRSQYAAFCADFPGTPIFFQPWWLDAVGGRDSWQVVFTRKDQRIMGALPYFTKKKFGFTILTGPLLTPFLGPLLRYPENQKNVSRYSFETSAIEDLLNSLPAHASYEQGLCYGLENCLPFLWKGYSASPAYSYVLEDLSDLEKVFANFDGRVRTDIRKAQKAVRVEESQDLELFLDLNQKIYARQGRAMPYAPDLVRRLNLACSERGVRRILFARDEQGRVHGGVYLVRDSKSLYYLMAGSDPELRSSGALSLLIWEAIQLAAKEKLTFDFEGSSIRQIEQFFRGFGGRRVSYFRISGGPSKAFRLLKGIQELLRRRG